MTTFDPEALLADARRRHQAALERVNRPCARKGVRTTTRREIRLNAEQRAGAFRAMKGPLGWLFAGSSPEDVVRDSTTLKKIMRIYRDRPRMRQSGGASSIFRAERRQIPPRHRGGDAAMIAGYERPSHVRAALEGFKRERQGTSDPRGRGLIV